MRWLAFLAISIIACSSRASSVAKTDSAAKKTSLPTTPVPTSVTPPNSAAALPPMPLSPNASRGHMVVLGAGPAGSDPISRDWPADGGLCENPARLLVKSEQPGAGGTLLLLHLPANRVTTYPIALPSRDAPSPPVANLGVQVYSKTGPLAYQAAEGMVEISAMGTTVSGRFGVTLQEINRRDRVRYAGSFREIPVVRLDSARCAPSAPIDASRH